MSPAQLPQEGVTLERNASPKTEYLLFRATSLLALNYSSFTSSRPELCRACRLSQVLSDYAASAARYSWSFLSNSGLGRPVDEGDCLGKTDTKNH